ncbi:high affinity immunoglobulin epsilon receptor subunit alpha-like [Electrophorus electricus]|uniref:high affinity immunoglobulin epsilon receptor subunit alpha-like n=1 Tax=Electrophorus electricus TaxID=8005 RepID=UPI0015D0B435|nr:high affinity immunoglobulin epsilon receptor subunit alpha-like [Electrophorus electricus]
MVVIFPSLSLSCKGQSDSTGWRVRGYTHSGNVSDCLSPWGSVTGSTCTIRYLYTSHTGVYWCQSESGGSSNPVNITVHNGGVILESSVHPVTEGDPLTLHCFLHPTITSHLRADLYKDGSLIQTQTAGEITIRTVSKSDEGVYYCKHPERGESPHSWVSVRALSHSEAPFSILSLLSSLLAVSPYLLVSIVLGVKCYRAHALTKNAVSEE